MPIDPVNAYMAAQAAGRQQLQADAEMAMSVAEMMGQVTPDLQQRILAPLGQNPTNLEALMGGAERGIGGALSKIPGIGGAFEGMAKSDVGKTKPYELVPSEMTGTTPTLQTKVQQEKAKSVRDLADWMAKEKFRPEWEIEKDRLATEETQLGIQIKKADLLKESAVTTKTAQTEKVIKERMKADPKLTYGDALLGYTKELTKAGEKVPKEYQLLDKYNTRNKTNLTLPQFTKLMSESKQSIRSQAIRAAQKDIRVLMEEVTVEDVLPDYIRMFTNDGKNTVDGQAIKNMEGKEKSKAQEKELESLGIDAKRLNEIYEQAKEIDPDITKDKVMDELLKESKPQSKKAK